MKISCPGCGHRVELDEAYDDFKGPVRCWVCRELFEIRIEDGCVKEVGICLSTLTSQQQ